MAHTNPDNKLKCDVAGHKGWREVKFFAGKDETGKAMTIPGFKNVLTDQEHVGDRPPGATGDIAICRHNSALFRQNYDQIRWDR